MLSTVSTPACPLCPPGSRGFQWWSFVVLVVTLVVAFAIPIDLAWPLVAKSSAAYILANAIFYLVFWLDMLVQFNLAVWMADGSVIATRRRIALHYLLTWFALDLISSMPWDLILGQKRGNLFRLLKLLRFGRLAQALAGEHVLRQYERRKPVQYELLQLWRFAVLLPLVLHFMGCGLYIIANIANETYDFREANGIEGDSQFLQWVYGIYWAAMTVSTIGYGDVSLVTYAERGYAIACMIIGATCYAYLVGAVINIMLKMGAKEQERRDGLAAVNYLMANIKLPVHMQVRVRHFLADVHTLRVPQLMDHQDELKKLSPPCVAYIARYLFRGWLPQVWWLRTSDDSFITRLALIVKSDAFAPQEPLFRAGQCANAIFVLSSGVLVRYTVAGTRLADCQRGFRSSRFLFGEETILRTVSAYTYGAAAATYVGVWRIDRPALMELLDEFPNMRARVRWAAAMLLLRRMKVLGANGPPPKAISATPTPRRSFIDVAESVLSDVEEAAPVSTAAASLNAVAALNGSGPIFSGAAARSAGGDGSGSGGSSGSGGGGGGDSGGGGTSSGSNEADGDSAAVSTELQSLAATMRAALQRMEQLQGRMAAAEAKQ
eukprot:TRINITY_DN338_c0_g1_i6.p1 TRINITY_DN338_c0_g1~~TRINITY_DN338_c0_g1_i6.p1  ORF type:complete len:606 (-),score=193.34 TRINITY_DN338_c0_g1_i6:837-2654(-)